jgi:hypothetical protein
MVPGDSRAAPTRATGRGAKGSKKGPLELDKLHQLLTFVLGVEAPGLSLHQRGLTQVKVKLFPVKLDLLLP